MMFMLDGNDGDSCMSTYIIEAICHIGTIDVINCIQTEQPWASRIGGNDGETCVSCAVVARKSSWTLPVLVVRYLGKMSCGYMLSWTDVYWRRYSFWYLYYQISPVKVIHSTAPLNRTRHLKLLWFFNFVLPFIHLYQHRYTSSPISSPRTSSA